MRYIPILVNIHNCINYKVYHPFSCWIRWIMIELTPPIMNFNSPSERLIIQNISVICLVLKEYKLYSISPMSIVPYGYMSTFFIIILLLMVKIGFYPKGILRQTLLVRFRHYCIY